MALLKPKRIPDAWNVDAALVAADPAGDVISDHASVAIVRNAGAGSITVTVNRTGDADQTVTIPAGAIYLIRLASARSLAYSAVTSVTVGFFSL